MISYKLLISQLIIFSSIFAKIPDSFPNDFSKIINENSKYGRLHKVEPLPDQGGSFINDVYLITTSTGEELVLKLENTNWKACKTLNEVSSIRYISENTKIPVPFIIEYNNQILSSPLSLEYILMSREKGRPLNLIIDEIYLNKKIYLQILNELADIMAELHSIQFKYMGNFENTNNELKIISPIEFPTYAMSRPCSKFSDYAYAWLSYYVEEMKRLQLLNHPNRDHFSRLIPRFETLLANTDLSFLNTSEDQFIYCHQDFVMKNILIDKGHLSAVLDWEWSGPSLPEFEIKTGFDFLLTEEDKKTFEGLMTDRGFPDFFRQPPHQRQLFYNLIGNLYSLISCYEWLEGKLEHSAKFLDQKLEQRMVKKTKDFDIENFVSEKVILIEQDLANIENL